MDLAPRRMMLPAWLAGFALGGFLDGILLHQVLQWHHLLSGITDAADLRFQMLWDGAFHAAHYALALAALVLFGLRRGAAPGAGRVMLGAALLGFGAWHLLDAVVNHWAIGLHRIRQDSPDPLFWDLVFFALGASTAAIGAWLLRRRGGGDGRMVAPALAALLVMAAPIAASGTPDPAVVALMGGGVLPGSCATWTLLAATAASP